MMNRVGQSGYRTRFKKRGGQQTEGKTSHYVRSDGSKKNPAKKKSHSTDDKTHLSSAWSVGRENLLQGGEEDEQQRIGEGGKEGGQDLAEKQATRDESGYTA